MMTDDDLRALLALARRTGDTPWTADGESVEEHGAMVADCWDGRQDFIAAFDPPTVAALLTELLKRRMG